MKSSGVPLFEKVKRQFTALAFSVMRKESMCSSVVA